MLTLLIPLVRFCAKPRRHMTSLPKFEMLNSLQPPPLAVMATHTSPRASTVLQALRSHRPLISPIRSHRRTFVASRSQQNQQHHRKQSFRSRLRASLGATKIEWRPIPVGLGIAFLGGWHLYRVQAQARERAREEVEGEQPHKRGKAKISGPWCVAFLSLGK